MKQDNQVADASSFAGQWVGETQGCEMPAHLWEITQYGQYLTIKTCWEGDSHFAYFSAQIFPEERAFRILNIPDFNHAVLVDSQHFVIQGWCWGTKEDLAEVKTRYDVVFSRPGIAELTARTSYLKSLEPKPQPD